MKLGALRPLYRAKDFPILQNRMYTRAQEACACPKGDLMIVEDLETGLVYNASFQHDLLDYDANYQNEQAVSPFF